MRPAGAIGVAGISCGAQRDDVRLERAARVPVEPARCHRHLHRAPDGGRAPRLRDHQRHEVLELLAHATAAADSSVGALLGRRLRPRLERLPRRPGGVVRLLHRRLGRDPDGDLGRRVHDLVAAVAALDPLAADEEPLVRPVRRHAHVALPRYDPQGRTCSHFVSSGVITDGPRPGRHLDVRPRPPARRAGARGGGRARGARVRRHLDPGRRRPRPARARRAPPRRDEPHRASAPASRRSTDATR